jgi:hypothetical protein
MPLVTKGYSSARALLVVRTRRPFGYEARTLNLHQDRLYALTRREGGEILIMSMRQCQRGVLRASGTLGTLTLSISGAVHALLWARRRESPGTLPIIVCHDEIVVKSPIHGRFIAKCSNLVRE